jgi:hypothetical protein
MDPNELRKLIFIACFDDPATIYYQIKLTQLEKDSKKSHMITFINCSSQVLYDKEKNHSELLMLVNATVSHEMRNPLNSICS